MGVWRPNRQINQDEPAFADAGFTLGQSYQWRVRARIGQSAPPGFVEYHAPGAPRAPPERLPVVAGHGRY